MGLRGGCLYGWMVTGALLSLLAQGAVHLFDWWAPGDEYGLFPMLEPDVWKKFDIAVVNADWLFYIWVVVYMLQVVWVLYGYQLLCRGTPVGNLYSELAVLPGHCFTLYICAMMAQFGWLMLWTREYYYYSPLCLAVSCVLAHVILGMAVTGTRRFSAHLQKAKSIGIIWENKWVVHNAIAAYSAWTSVVLLHVIAVILQQKSEIADDMAGFVFLGVVMGYLGVWFTVDVFVAKDLMHALITPYIVVSISLAAVLVKNINELDYYFTVSAVFLSFSLIIIIIKLCVMCWYKRLLKDKYFDADMRRQDIQMDQMHRAEHGQRGGRLVLDPVR